MAKCMVFLRERGKVERKEGLGVHVFGRIPISSEYLWLDRLKKSYRVTHVHHTGGMDHEAELYVIDADDMEKIGGEDNPPAAE